LNLDIWLFGKLNTHFLDVGVAFIMNDPSVTVDVISGNTAVAGIIDDGHDGSKDRHGNYLWLVSGIPCGEELFLREVDAKNGSILSRVDV